MVETETKIQRYESYKDSGVEWLGDIPEHWDMERLGSILNPISSKNHPEETLLSITREQGVIVRGLEDEDDNHNYIPDDLSGYLKYSSILFLFNEIFLGYKAERALIEFEK